MSFAATRAPQGFEFVREVADNEIIHWPGDPGVTFTRGNALVITAGVLALAADSSADVVGYCEKTVVSPAALDGDFPIPGPGGQVRDLDGAEAKTLIAFRPAIARGTQVHRAKFANHKDETVLSINAATRSIGLTTGLTADNYGIGGLVYIYDGTGKGQWNIIEDYDHTGGNVELEIILHRWFEVAPDTTSKLLIFANAGAASDGLSLLSGGRMDLDTVAQLDVSDGYDDGDYDIYSDFLGLSTHVDGPRVQQALPVIKYSNFA